MDFLRTILVFIAVLSVLVVVHEWGHFIAAKLCGMRVDDFSLFFGKRIWRIGVYHGTEYNVRSVPMGGFVKIAGMEPEDIYSGSYVAQPGSKKNPRLLAGLDFANLRDVDEKHISDKISGAIYNAIGDNRELTTSGRQELEMLVGSEATNDDERKYLAEVLKAAPREPDPQAYNQKPLWQRATVIFAGPFASLMLGYVIFCVMGSTTGLPVLPDKDGGIAPVVGMVSPGKAADKAGLKMGDRVTQIDGKPINNSKQMIEAVSGKPNQLVTLSVLRGTETLQFRLTPAPEKVTVEENKKKIEKTIGRIGIGFDQTWKRYDSPMTSVREGTSLIVLMVKTMAQKIFSREASENLSGPIGIAGQIHQDSQSGIKSVVLTGAQLSVSLGFMNLLPIPLLDGGHLLLLALEGIRRRKLSFQEFIAAQKVGILVIGTIFILVMYNDLKHLIFKG